MLSATMSLQQLDDEVIRKAQRGDQDAFALIVRTYEVPVYNTSFASSTTARSPRT